jgi:hypothetical protein
MPVRAILVLTYELNPNSQRDRLKVNLTNGIVVAVVVVIVVVLMNENLP